MEASTRLAPPLGQCRLQPGATPVWPACAVRSSSRLQRRSATGCRCMQETGRRCARRHAGGGCGAPFVRLLSSRLLRVKALALRYQGWECTLGAPVLPWFRVRSECTSAQVLPARLARCAHFTRAARSSACLDLFVSRRPRSGSQALPHPFVLSEEGPLSPGRSRRRGGPTSRAPMCGPQRDWSPGVACPK